MNPANAHLHAAHHSVHQPFWGPLLHWHFSQWVAILPILLTVITAIVAPLVTVFLKRRRTVRREQTRVHALAVKRAAEDFRRGGATPQQARALGHAAASLLRDRHFCAAHVATVVPRATDRFTAWQHDLGAAVAGQQIGEMRIGEDQVRAFLMHFFHQLANEMCEVADLKGQGDDIAKHLLELRAASAPPPRAEAPHAIIPPTVTPFLGRQGEVEAIARKVQLYKIVTLTGSGGVGKTRLALEVAARRKDDFNYVRVIDLTTLPEQNLHQQVALSLDIKNLGDQNILESLKAHLKEGRLRDKSVFLVLDNCESLLDDRTGTENPCRHLADMLARECGNVNILATSTRALDVVEECLHKVHPLEVPHEAVQDHRRLLEFESVQFFIERARAANSDFQVEGYTPLIAAICRRLGGLPLALSLAAARLRKGMLSLKDLDETLYDLFHAQEDFGATVAHQKNLQVLVDWSYNRLSEDQKALMRQASVFQGGWTRDALSAVAWEDSAGGGLSTAAPSATAARMRALVDYSLVDCYERGGETRFRLLETIRHYADEKLGAEGKRLTAQRRHRDFFLHFAEAAERMRTTDKGDKALDAAERDHDNLRAALEWSHEARAGEDAGAEAVAGLTLAGALWRFWEVRGYLLEARTRLEAALARVGAGAPSAARARALLAVGRVSQSLGDMAAAGQRLEESVAVFGAVGDRKGMALAQIDLGWVRTHRGEYGAAWVLYDQCLATLMELSASSDDRALPKGIASTRYNQGIAALCQGRYADTRGFLEKSLAGHQALQNGTGSAVALVGLANVDMNEGDFASARQGLDESSGIYGRLGDARGVASVAISLGALSFYHGHDPTATRRQLSQGLEKMSEIASRDAAVLEGLRLFGAVSLQQQEYGEARKALGEGLRLARKLGDRRQAAAFLEAWGRLCLADGRAEQAAEAFGVAQALRDAIGAPRPPVEAAAHERDISAVKTAMGEKKFTEVAAAGGKQDWEAAVSAALAA